MKEELAQNKVQNIILLRWLWYNGHLEKKKNAKRTQTNKQIQNKKTQTYLSKCCMIFPDICVHGHIHGHRTATSFKWERGNKKEFECSVTREINNLGSTTFFCQNVIHVADNIEIFTTRFNSQVLTVSPAVSGSSMQQCRVSICLLLLHRFCPLGFHKPKRVI